MDSPQQLSENYSFRSSGETLRIYHGDTVEQVTFAIGGSFTWSESGTGYSLTLKEVKTGESVGTLPDGTDGPLITSGIFELSVNDPVSGVATSIVEIKR